ncbi:enoyl-CoA hydratase/isomerase family protein [Streptomyces silaceus]|uniref:enoyl-CoA hydratase/isomerase family protein n=1 Tax=Streptomyces silaceus TaxID=545123 RepID=UPI0006EBC640|nr:enoyl-CoA hydratase/isomerase family protein [Streptomyces silaceus]
MGAWTSRSGHIDVSVRDEVAVITLDRPDRLNALTATMRRELAAVLRHFGDGALARGIVLTGTGRAFCAGEDLREAASTAANGLVAEAELFHDITRAALGTRVPTLAALNGIAVGGAGELTLCFDARIGTPDAGYFFPENDIGLTVTNAASVLLPRLVGVGPALELVLGSARLNARQALDMGLLDGIVDPAADLVPAAIRRIHRWNRPGAATAEHLALLRPRRDAVEAAMARESEAVRRTEEIGSARAGIDRFLSRRRARH